QGLHSQCETTQQREQGRGAALFGYTKLYGEVPGGQAEYLRVPFGNVLPVKVPEGPSDDRFVFLSDVLPTAWQAVEYADVPDGGTVLVLGLGPIGEMATRVAQHRGLRVLAVDLVPDRLERARSPRRDDLDRRRVRRHGRSAAVDDAVRQAGADPHGPGERAALGAGDHAAAARRRPARHRVVRDAPPPARRGAERVRALPEEGG